MDPFRSRKPKSVRQYNQRVILSLLQLSGEMSITELSEATNLSKTSISKIFADFCSLGIVTSMGKGESSADGGKKPELFALNPDFRYTIVLSLIRPEYIDCSIVNMNHQTKYSKRYSFEDNVTASGLYELLTTAVTDSLDHTGIDPSLLLGVAIACNGIVNTETGVLLYPAHPILESPLALREELEQRLPFTTTISVDTAQRFSAYAELLFPENRESTSLIVISTKYHLVGASILTKQKLVPGHGGVVGDFGHIVVDPSSPILCTCGQHGCISSLVNEDAILQQVSSHWQDYKDSPITQAYLTGNLTHREIFTQANIGDPLACELMEYLIKYFGILLHNLISVNSAKRIVLQGFYATEGPYFLEHLRDRVINFNQFHLCNNIQMDYSKLDTPEYSDTEAYILGASLLLSMEYFDHIEF